MALYGMAPVGFCIENVVEAIDTRCGKAIGKESDDTGQKSVGVKQSSAKEQRYKDESVLDPLFGAYESHQRREAPAFVHSIIYFFMILCFL